MSRSAIKIGLIAVVGLAGVIGQAKAISLGEGPAAALEVVQQGRGHNIVVGLAPHPDDLSENGAVYLIARNRDGTAIYISRNGVSPSPAVFYSGQMRPEMMWQLPLQDASQYESVDGAICAMTFPQNHGGSVEISLAYGSMPVSRTTPENAARSIKAYDRVIEIARKMGMEERARSAEAARDKYAETMRNAQAAKLGAENDSTGSALAFKESWVLMDVPCN